MVGKRGGTYPPTGATVVWTDANVNQVVNDFYQQAYWNTVAVMRWNTAMPYRALTATLHLTIAGMKNADGQLLMGEWLTDGLITANDYALDIADSVFVMSISYANVFPIAINFALPTAGVNMSGYTKMRIGVVGDRPTGQNEVNLYAVDADNAPVLDLCVVPQ
jgi:hypothetical protein